MAAMQIVSHVVSFPQSVPPVPSVTFARSARGSRIWTTRSSKGS
jgi:hypothetical protein